MIKKIIQIYAIVLTIILPCICFGATQVIQKGIASPQSDAERGNIEKLRSRAIRNAMDLAVMQVTGTAVSSERGDSLRSQEKVISQGDQIREESRQESRFSRGATTRSEGHARLVEIIKEWQENDQYFVEAIIEVESEDETIKQKNCGDYWLQAGKPAISMTFIEEFNGHTSSNLQDNTFRFLRDNLSRNGVNVSTSRDEVSAYRINVLQNLQSQEIEGLGTITMHCRLSFQIIDQERDESIAEYRAFQGPKAGFTIEQAKEDCLKVIARDVSENLVRALGKIMLERWNNGVEQRIKITGLPGEAVAAVSEILQNLYRVTSATAAKYNDGQYIRSLTFKGSATELAQAIQSSFADENWKITVARIEKGDIDLQWVNTK